MRNRKVNPSSMSQLNPDRENNSGSSSPESAFSKEIIEDRLREAGIRVARSVNVANGSKMCDEYGHSNPTNHTFPGLINRSCTIHGGDGLVLIDIDVDDPSDLPDWVRDLPSTFVVGSPHGGCHLYYIVEDDSGISNTTAGWGSIRYDGLYVLGPGSTIDHELCDDGKASCPGEGIGTYDIQTDKPIATLSGDHLDALRDYCSESNNAEHIDSDPITAPNTALVDRGEITLRTLREISTPAFKTVMDFLQGGIADFDRERLTKENGKIDRDTQDSLALSLLYGTLRQIGDYDHSEALDIATATYTHYCQERPQTEDYQQRRWTTDTDDYRQRITSYAVHSYDDGEFKHLLNRGENSLRRQRNEYSDTSYKLARAAIDICCGDDIDWIESSYQLDLNPLLTAIDAHPSPPPHCPKI